MNAIQPTAQLQPLKGSAIPTKRNRLDMGAPMTTKLVGAISDPSRLAALADHPKSLVADWVEVRLDQIEPGDWPLAEDACRRLEAQGTTVLATIRLRSDGGSWHPDDEERVKRFKSVCQWASWIDVEVFSENARRIVDHAHSVGRKVVVSYHNFDGTPALEELENIYSRAQELGADIVKVSTLANEPADHDTLIQFLANHRDGSLCVIGMGASAVSLRMYLPTIGSALAYAYLDQPGAPGQLDAERLSEVLRLSAPGYQEMRLQKPGEELFL